MYQLLDIALFYYFWNVANVLKVLQQHGGSINHKFGTLNKFFTEIKGKK